MKRARAFATPRFGARRKRALAWSAARRSQCAPAIAARPSATRAWPSRTRSPPGCAHPHARARPPARGAQDFRGELAKDTSEVFFRELVDKGAGNCPPAFAVDGVSFVSVRSNGIHFLATSVDNVRAAPHRARRNARTRRAHRAAHFE
jgi:hypothetical protein